LALQTILSNEKIALLAALCVTMTSGFHAQHIVGNGPAGSTVAKGKNTYFIYGLVQGKQADTKAMAGGATDYKIDVRHSFVDGLLRVITFDIYSPTSVTVTK
jgi:Bor protein